MVIDDVKRVVENFVKYLQLPNSVYDIRESDSSDEVEVQISKGDELMAAVSISLGTVKILFNDDYDENKFFSRDFKSPIYLLYILSVVYYSTVGKDINFSFNELMTIVLGEEISNWKDLVIVLAKKCMINVESDMDDVLLDNQKLSYDDGTGIIEYGSLQFEIDSSKYTELVESIFLIVEYVATIKDTQDSLFSEEAEDNIIQEEQEEEPVGMGGSFGPPSDDFGGDDLIGGDTGAPEPVTPEEAENNPVNEDFSVPDGVDMDDLISDDLQE